MAPGAAVATCRLARCALVFDAPTRSFGPFVVQDCGALIDGELLRVKRVTLAVGDAEHAGAAGRRS